MINFFSRHKQIHSKTNLQQYLFRPPPSIPKQVACEQTNIGLERKQTVKKLNTRARPLNWWTTVQIRTFRVLKQDLKLQDE